MKHFLLCPGKNSGKFDPVKYWMKRLLLISLILNVTLVHSFAYRAVSQVVTLDKRNATLQSILRDIGEQTGYNFLIKEELYDKTVPINIKLNNATLVDALKQSLTPQQLTFVIHEEDKTIIVKSKEGK